MREFRVKPERAHAALGEILKRDAPGLLGHASSEIVASLGDPEPPSGLLPKWTFRVRVDGFRHYMLTLTRQSEFDGGDPRAHLLDPDPKAKPPETLGGDVVLKRAPDGDFAHVEPRADALVLWRSKLCYHAREPVKKGCRAVVRHWVFAAPDVMERNRHKAAAA